MSKAMFEQDLLGGVAATSTGFWVFVGDKKRISIHIKGITTATVQIRGSNAPVQPANNVDEIKIGNDITADTIYEITSKIKWLKVMVSAWTSGTIYAYTIADSTVYGL